MASPPLFPTGRIVNSIKTITLPSLLLDMYPTSFAMSLFILAFVLPYFLVSILHHLLSPKHDCGEPPLVPQKLPLVGHILGLLHHGHIYLERLSAKFGLPIYTLHTFTTRTYVVNSPELVIAVQRNARNLSFNPFVIAMMPRLFNVVGKDVEIASRNNDEEQGHWGFLPELHSSTYSVLAPGEELDGMIKPMLEGMGGYIDELSSTGTGPEVEIDLFAWLRRAMTAASTSAVYGPENPFTREYGLETAFWDFEREFTDLLLGIAPKYTARKAYRGRAKIAEAMQRYFERNGQERGSGLVKTRYDAGKKHGLSMETISVFELGDCIGVLINSVPTTFWLLYHIFSSPDLLASIREELSSAITTTPDSDGTACTNIPVHKLQGTCPLLTATYKEVLRHRTHSSSSRYVRHDTLLDNHYLLKKESIIQIPSAVIHTNPELWGADAKEFNPRRFLKADSSAFSSSSSLASLGNESSTASAEERPNTGAALKKASFRAFGGGATLCPGRHFATSSILAVVSMLVMRFDITPVSGKWGEMKQAGDRLASTLPPPARDIRVVIKERAMQGGNDGKVYEERKWSWDFDGRVPRFDS